MVLFKDLNKDAKDTLKNFPHEKTWEIEHVRRGDNPSVTCNASMNSTIGLEGSTTFKLSKGNVRSELKLKSSKLSTGEVEYNVTEVPGLKVGAKYDSLSAKSLADSVDLTAEYAAHNFHGKSSFNVMNLGYNLSAVASAKYKGTAMLGGELKGTKLDYQKFKYGLGLAYKSSLQNNCYQASLLALSENQAKPSKLLFNFYAKSQGLTTSGEHAVDSSRSVAAAANSVVPSEYAVEASRSLTTGSMSIIFGGLWKLNTNPQTTIRFRVSHNGLVALALSHKLSDTFTGAVGVEISGVGQEVKATQLGLKLETKA